MKLFLRALGALLLVLTVLLAWQSWPPSTPPFIDDDGAPIAGSIAEEEWIEVNGLQQWTLTRGLDRDNPILLVLHGGPGAGEFAWFRAYNSNLEAEFVVVHWDQRGAGKSFDPEATPPESMNLPQFIADIDVVVDHLRAKFGRERITLLGHSWGSLLGTMYAAAHPEKVSAYIGTGQIADMTDNERVSYEFALAEATRRQHAQAMEELTEIGPPPYSVEATLIQRQWLTEFGGGLTHDGRSQASLAWVALSMPEFNLLDLIALIRSAFFALDHLWEGLASANLDRTLLTFDVPVFFILGRHDYQTPSVLAEPFFNELTAPDKELFYFENSAHAPPWEEPDRFFQVMVSDIKPRLLADR